MKVSIVIPNYNGQKLLVKNLPKVVAASLGAEIIIVDDASIDKSVDFIRKNFPKIKIVKHKKNQRFAIACNNGIKHAIGDIVILLNSDVVPKKNFIKPLIDHFQDNLVFSVGCREIELKKGKKIVSGRTAGSFKRGFLVHYRPKNQTSQDTFWTFGGSMAVSRKKYLAIGGMDKIYSPAYWEDIDLCWRARKRGWKILFEKNSIVYHHHETTNLSAFGQRQLKTYAMRNQILFVWKNIRGWQLIEHFLWLPYHLIFTTLRTKGIFLIAYFLAIKKFFYPKMVS